MLFYEVTHDLGTRSDTYRDPVEAVAPPESVEPGPGVRRGHPGRGYNMRPRVPNVKVPR